MSRSSTMKRCRSALSKFRPVLSPSLSDLVTWLDNLIMDALNNLKEPGGSNKTAMTTYIGGSCIGKLIIRNKSCKELTAKCNVLGRGEAHALCKLGKAKEKIKKLKARIQELKTAVEVKDNEVSRALKASKKTILEGDVLNDVDWNSNSSSISEDLAVEKNYFSRSEAASDTRSEVHRPCNKNGVSGSQSAFWTNEDWENSKIATVSPTDTVLMATKKMVEYGMSSAVVAVENKTRGILTSKDILMRVIAQNLPPESTPVEKVIFLLGFFPLLKILQDRFPTLRQSCLIPLLSKFKIRRVECIDSIVVCLFFCLSRCDLAAAVDHARLLAGWKVLKLHLDHSGTQGHRRGSQSGGVEYAQSDVWASAYSALAAGAALIAGLSMLAYLRRNGN
ncbi:CBS domain-containing protein CBSCBSPB1 [Camellia lanceoleosa]|uniref:CBS domain-containing protein CBSCBSPB1 n=1 Tax=Camellia lanceoleosa TaxID=1840588 RepID=A0ACC0HAT6_9ERIC|nr:CBS domain-containing protein CBSCBSPB1 [Camellia lanceoleosa]